MRLTSSKKALPQLSRFPYARPLMRRNLCRALTTVLFLVATVPISLRAGSSETTSSETSGAAVTDTGNFSRVPFRVSVAVRGGYDDNVYTTRFNVIDSAFTNVAVELRYDFGNPRTKITLTSGAGFTYYFDRPGRDYDVNAYVSLNVTHRATPRLTLGASVYATYESEPNFALGVGLTRRSGNYFYTVDKFSVGYMWTPRFSTMTSYTLGVLQYENSDIGAIQDRFEHTFGQEFRFLLLPTTNIVAEYRFGIVDYDELPRDSHTHFVLAGFDHSFSPRLNASFRGGAEFRSYEDGRDVTAPYFEGTVNYALGKRTSVSWTSRYAIEEPDVPQTPSRTTFRTGLRVNYGVTARLSASLAAYYEHDWNDEYEDPQTIIPAFEEDAFDVALGLRYAITRDLAAEIGYTHTEVFSDILLREYSRNRYYGGLYFTF